MKLYREHGVNPLGGCLPHARAVSIPACGLSGHLSAQHAFQNADWLWIGSPLSHHFPKWLATNLFQPDYIAPDPLRRVHVLLDEADADAFRWTSSSGR